MFYSDDPVADAQRYYDYLDSLAAACPVCEHCGEHIQDEHCCKVGDLFFHEECIVEHYGVKTDDYTND